MLWEFSDITAMLSRTAPSETRSPSISERTRPLPSDIVAEAERTFSAVLSISESESMTFLDCEFWFSRAARTDSTREFVSWILEETPENAELESFEAETISPMES